MKQLTRWIPVLLLLVAMTLTTSCSEEKAGGDEGADDATEEAAAKDDTGEEAAEEKEAADPAKVAEPGAEGATEGAKAPTDAATTERCGKAFDNTLSIMEKAGAPPQIVTQMRKQRDKTVVTCLAQAKADPGGTRMLDCMLVAQVPVDIQTCTRKFGDIKPIKKPTIDDSHGH